MKRKYTLTLIFNVLIWGFPTIFIKYLTSYFDLYTQNFYRYIGASLFLLLFLGGRKKTEKTFPLFKVIPLGLFLVGIQTLWVGGIYLVSATLSSLLSKTETFWIIFFSYFMFLEEKKVVRTRHFLLGTILAFVGVIGVILGGKEVSLKGYWLGIIIILLSRIGWGVFTVSIKHLSFSLNSLLLTTSILSFSSLFFVPLAFFLGEPAQIFQASLLTNFILFFSGILCVGVGQLLYYYNLEKIGPVITNIFILLTPLITGIFAFLFLGETITFIQIISGGMLLLGCYVVGWLDGRS